MKACFLVFAALFIISTTAFATSEVVCGSGSAGNFEAAQRDLNSQLKDRAAQFSSVSAPNVATIDDGTFRSVVVCVTVVLKP